MKPNLLIIASILWSQLSQAYPFPQISLEGGNVHRWMVVQGVVVVDMETGNEWQLEAGPALSFEEAEKYCDELTLEGKKWKLPTREQLITITDCDKMFPSIVDVFTLKGKQRRFWTRTRVANWPIYSRWLIDFEKGELDRGDISHPYFTRCVHTKAELPVSTTVSGDEL